MKKIKLLILASVFAMAFSACSDHAENDDKPSKTSTKDSEVSSQTTESVEEEEGYDTFVKGDSTSFDFYFDVGHKYVCQMKFGTISHYIYERSEKNGGKVPDSEVDHNYVGFVGAQFSSEIKDFDYPIEEIYDTIFEDTISESGLYPGDELSREEERCTVNGIDCIRYTIEFEDDNSDNTDFFYMYAFNLNGTPCLLGAGECAEENNEALREKIITLTESVMKTVRTTQERQ